MDNANENNFGFVLESSDDLLNNRMNVYRFKDTDFRLVFVHVPGPLCSASILIPTIASNDAGLPHTLEHLVFCGSERYKRGYLDTLASRSLSTGTNAYTAQDHTCYEIVTAGWNGMNDVFSVFLDHILHPTLTESQFLTEVCHLNGDAKYQGVVYCEMSARQDTEPDLLDLNLRRLMYSGCPTYSSECGTVILIQGGLTKEIAKLNNKQIIDYHQKFYHLHQTTAIITGPSVPEELFQKLAMHGSLLNPAPLEMDHLIYKHPSPLKESFISKTIKFPSADEDVGSIAYGPPSEDYRTIVAIDVLFRFLQETQASVLCQQFVERSSPYASDIDFEQKGFIDTGLFLIFSGVPHSGGEAESSSASGSASVSELGGSEKGDEEESRDDLFEEGVFYSILKDAINLFVKTGFSEGENMLKTIKRHVQKINEAIEEEPHELIANFIIPDITRYFLAQRSALEDVKSKGEKPHFGSRKNVFSILKDLENEPAQFWTGLAKRYLLGQPVREILMIPDAQLAKDLEVKETKDQQKRMKSLGKKKLADLKRKIDLAVSENVINLSEEAKFSMPSITDASLAPSLASQVKNIDMADLCDDQFPFQSCQVIRTETEFVHLGFGINIMGISDALRPFLVIFQELMFQSPLELPLSSGEAEKTILDYKEVVKYSSELFISHGLGVGFGNGMWSCAWLSQVLTFFTSSNKEDWERMIRFSSQVILFTKFTSDRIITIAKNLLTNLTEIKRDGDGMLSFLANRMCYSSKNGSSIYEGQNDSAISIFQQESMLKHIIEQCKNGSEDNIIKSLDALRIQILSSNMANENAPSFMRLAVPRKYSLHATRSTEMKEFAQDARRIWIEEFKKFGETVTLKKRKFAGDNKKCTAFPFPRVAYSLSHLDSKLTRNIAIPIGGLNTSYLVQFVPCDLLNPLPHPDYFSVCLLSEILSRTEGPLYTAVRGLGISAYLWHGQLSFEIYRASDPRNATLAFYRIIEKLLTQDGFDELCSPFDIETAQSSIAYKWVSDRSTSGSVIATSLRISLWGFKSLEDHTKYIEQLYRVTKADLIRCAAKYFSKFLGEERVTCLTTTPGEHHKNLIAQFESTEEMSPQAHNISFQTVDWEDLEFS